MREAERKEIFRRLPKPSVAPLSLLLRANWAEPGLSLGRTTLEQASRVRSTSFPSSPSSSKCIAGSASSVFSLTLLEFLVWMPEKGPSLPPPPRIVAREFATGVSMEWSDNLERSIWRVKIFEGRKDGFFLTRNTLIELKRLVLKRRRKFNNIIVFD